MVLRTDLWEGVAHGVSRMVGTPRWGRYVGEWMAGWSQLEAFVNRPDWSASEQEIVESLTRLEQDVLDAAAAEDSLRYEDPDRIEILMDVL